MQSDFADLAMFSRAVVDAVHGETARLRPADRAKGPHGKLTASADRPETDIVVAFFQDTEFAARSRAQPTFGQAGDRMANRSPEIYGSTGFAGDIAVGDRLTRGPGGADTNYEIVAIDPDGIGNRILGLARIKG